MTHDGATIRRLGLADQAAARATFSLMAKVFDEGVEPLSDGYLDQLLRRPEFWVLAAFENDRAIGGLTGHELMMTRSEATEIFLYDIAVDTEHHRRGIGRRLVDTLRTMARTEGIDVIFVPADNQDTHALDFYRSLGGRPAAVTMFDL